MSGGLVMDGYVGVRVFGRGGTCWVVGCLVRRE